MGKLHRENAGYIGGDFQKLTQDIYQPYTDVFLPLHQAQTQGNTTESHRYWRVLAAGGAGSHFCRSSRILLYDTLGNATNVVVFTGDNCGDSGTIINGGDVYSYDFGTNVTINRIGAYVVFAGPRGGNYIVQWSDDNTNWTTLGGATIIAGSCGIHQKFITKNYGGIDGIQPSLDALIGTWDASVSSPSGYGGATRFYNSNVEVGTYPNPNWVQATSTLEMWVRFHPTAFTNRQFLVGHSLWGNNTASYNQGIRIDCTNGSGAVDYGPFNTTFTYSSDTWFHLAIVKEGAQLRLYKDGIKIRDIGQTGGNSSQLIGNLILGNQGSILGNGGIYSAYFNGWMQDFRYTVGVARYRSDFTPPTNLLSNGSQYPGGCFVIS